MSNKIDVSNNDDRSKLNVILRKSFQSANINFLIGSGCSSPAIKPSGDVEKEIRNLLDEGKELEAEKLMCRFLKPIAESNDGLIGGNDDPDITTTLNNYKTFLGNIIQILTKRKSNILLKQANIFNTNYDLFIHKASEEFASALRLHDGFNRNPKLDSRFKFSTTEFFNTVYNKGNLYNYQVEIPCLNLIKLHGSLSWEKSEADIIFQVNGNSLGKLKDNSQAIQDAKKNNDDVKLLSLLKEFSNQFYIILPVKDKFRDTLLDRVYYDLLRIYANELDKENTLLLAEGFSFEDEHILDITHRALKNPTLRLIIFCYKKGNVEEYEGKFGQYNNLDLVYNEDGSLDFSEFNNRLKLKDILAPENPQVKDEIGPQNGEEND
jgi:hypothetical protein